MDSTVPNLPAFRDGLRVDAPQGPRPPARFLFLDGMRGLSALFVVLHHAAFEVPRGALTHAPTVATRFLFEYGHRSVAIFIVLSGFSLMLPVVRSADGDLRGGILGYLKRRARRILPPYYAALFLALAMIACLPILRSPAGVRWDVALPALDAEVILSHVFLLHNLRPDWAYRIDPPLWSVATEWQIYFVFPLLLGVWRRYGISVTIAAGFLAGYLVHLYDHVVADVTCSWYIGLFAIGMAAALAIEPRHNRAARWGDVSLGFLAVGAVVFAVAAPPMMVSDTLAGIAIAGLITYCVRRSSDVSGRPRVLQLLESPQAVWLGRISYSLYLIHFPLLSLASGIFRGWGIGPATRLTLLLTAASPACVGVAYLFSLAFERPFLNEPSSARNPRLPLHRHAS